MGYEADIICLAKTCFLRRPRTLTFFSRTRFKQTSSPTNTSQHHTMQVIHGKKGTLKKHVHHKRNAAVQNLTFSDGWVDKFKKRHRLVRRIGDMQKLGKLPSLAEVSDNQEKCQIEYDRLDCLPALIATAGKFSCCWLFCLSLLRIVVRRFRILRIRTNLSGASSLFMVQTPGKR